LNKKLSVYKAKAARTNPKTPAKLAPTLTLEAALPDGAALLELGDDPVPVGVPDPV